MNVLKYCNGLTFFFLILLNPFGIRAQETPGSKNKTVFVDPSGVMRWGESRKEVKGFGVNYTVPFAHAYRSAEKMGVNIKKAIDQDVYHLTRLGFDLYRVHVWDTEISDARGNLLKNEHLKMFDYLIKQLKDRGFNFVVTPIAYWGNGWPEPDQDTPGFSNEYGKGESLVNPKAIAAQENYLAQFLNHVNPYTGLAYKEDSSVIAFEISNEPHHRGTPDEVTSFIKKMVASMRSTGTEKPIFYNISHSVHLAPAYFNSDIQGGTFQWYPTGLGYGKPLEGNLLPNVDRYDIPFDSVIEANSGAKLVYEFDAADVMGNYIYPAMARSFREAGIQLATHFAYDPTYMASGNTEYNTHFMNLAYTPKKALALMISSEVFHRIPLNSDYGSYPDNTSFDGFRVDYSKNLAELNLPETFIYTNHTRSEPVEISELEQIAGYGNSPVIKYQGKGAYFLDKIEEEVWRLEVMPDALLVRNPFGKNSLEKEVAVINWKDWNMEIRLPQLGNDFTVDAINKGNNYNPDVTGNSFNIRPGTYLITKKGKQHNVSPGDQWQEITLNEFFAPESSLERMYVIHQPKEVISGSDTLVVSAKIIAPEAIKKVTILANNSNIYEQTGMENTQGYTFEAKLPANLAALGYLHYRIVVETAEKNISFPGGNIGKPWDWNFVSKEQYKTRVVESAAPINLFNAFEDGKWVIGQWLKSIKLVPSSLPGLAEYQMNVEQLYEEDPENRNAEKIFDYSFKFYFGDKIAGRKNDLSEKENLVIKARSLKEKPVKLQIALVMDNGASFGKIVVLDPQLKEYRIPLSRLQPVKTVLLPRPYPTFLPYYFIHEQTAPFDTQRIESLQFSIGPGLGEEQLDEEHGVGIQWVQLQ